MKRRDFLIGGAAVVASATARINSAVARSNQVTVADFLNQYGATDNAIQSAINLAVKSGFPTVLLPPLSAGRAYEVGKTIQNDGVQLIGAGASTVVRKFGRGSCFASGHIPSAIARMEGDITAGSDRIDLGICPGLELKVGATYILTSDCRCHTNTPAHCGEFVIVKHIENSRAILDRRLLYSYRISEDACIRDANLVSGVGYRDLVIQMDPEVVPAGAFTRFDNYGIQLDFCVSPLIKGVCISDGVAAGIRLLGCLNARVEDYRAFNLGSADDDRNGTSTMGLGGYGYGVSERGLNEGLVVEGAHTERVRHLYTSGAEWVDVFKYGMPSHSLVRNSTSKNAKAACFDTHETGMNITFENCHAEGGRAVGFQIRSKSAKVISCTARNLAGAAVWIYGANVHENAAGDGCLISELQCANVNGAPPTGFGAGVDWRDTGAILDQGFYNEFKSIRVDGCAGPALTIASAARGGLYQDFKLSRVCQSTVSMEYVIAVEQNSADAAPKINGVHVSNSPRVKELVKVTNANCRPDVSNFSIS